MKHALFLDRDGVLDELVYYESSGEWESPRTVEDIRMIDGIAEPLQRFVDAGWLLFVITNQPSYAKGKVSLESLQQVQEMIVRALPVTRAYACFHHPDATVETMRVACDCRKPGTKFLGDAAAEFDLDLSQSWMVGDQDSDLACGRAAGCHVALIEHRGSEHKRGKIEPDLRVKDLAELADAILPTSVERDGLR